MTSQEMIQLFLEETIDRLSEMSNNLLELERESNNPDLISKLFRVAHTIKGNASTAHNTLIDMDCNESVLSHIEKMAKLTHGLENLIMEARDNGLILTPQRVELLFESENILEILVQHIENSIEEEVDIETLKEQIRLATSDDEIGPVSFNDESDELNFAQIFEIALSSEADSYKHAFLSLIYRDIEENFSNPYFSPSYDHLMIGEDFDHIFIKFETSVDVHQFISFVSELEMVEKASLFSSVVENVPAKQEAPAPKVESVIEVKPAPAKAETKTPPVEMINQQLAAKEEAKKATPVNKNNASVQNIKVAINRIDEVLKHVSSLVILKNKLSTYANSSEGYLKDLKEVSEQISQTVDFLQDSVMQIRMTPLEQLFNRFPMDVRKISKEFEKEMAFSSEGGDTEIDKSLLDDLFDPLMHLIRNSIFHGIESPEERIKAGKNSQGKLHLSARHEQSMVVITVEDDGKGIDTEKVVRKAIEKGIITEEKAKFTSVQELNNLIYHPGLSTADSVNSVAGRGVGMDAVRTKIEEMKGSIEVISTPGQGTKNIIRLPLTLAIIQAMLTKVEGNTFAFPLGSVEAVEMIDTKEIKYIANKEVYVLRGKEIPILRLREHFGIGTSSKEDKILYTVVVKSGDKQIGVTVDELKGQEDIVVKNIGKYLGNVPGISGCNILGNGDISLIVDVNSLFKQGI